MGNFIMPETGLIVVGKATNLLTDGGLNVWTTATNLTHWTEYVEGTSTVNRDNAEEIEGSYCCRFDVDASNSLARILQDFLMTPLKRYRITLWYMNSVAGKSSVIYLRDTGSTIYLKEDGTWQVGIVGILLSNSTVWKKFELDFSAHADYSNYNFGLYRSSAASSSIYFDNLSIEEYGEFVPKAIGTMNFDSGSVEPQVDETLRGAASGSLAKVVSVTRSGGTWGGGDAAGSISLTECEGRFHDNENIDGMVGGANILTVNHPDTAQGVDLIKNGEFSVDNDPPNGWIKGDPADVLTTEASGKIGNCMMITEGGIANPDAKQNIGVTPGKIYKLKVYVKEGTEASYQIVLHDYSHARNIKQINGEAGATWESHSFVVEAPPGCFIITNQLYQIIAGGAGTTIYYDEVSLYELVPDEVVGDGKTVMVNSVVFVPTDADGDRLLLTDYDGNKFVNMKGLANRPNPIFFKKPRKLNGLKVAIIDSGKAYIYLAQR